jgi:hypothetical protein
VVDRAREITALRCTVPIDDLRRCAMSELPGLPRKEARKGCPRIAPARRRWIRPVAAIACLVALGGCGDDDPEVKTGQWGGLGTELNVTTSGASVLLCCSSTGVIQEPLVPDASGYFKARGVLGGTLRADFDGTVSGDSLRLRITSYPVAYPEGFVINGPGGAEYRSLTYGAGFVEKEGTPPVGCVCLCVGCP